MKRKRFYDRPKVCYTAESNPRWPRPLAHLRGEAIGYVRHLLHTEGYVRPWSDVIAKWPQGSEANHD